MKAILIIISFFCASASIFAQENSTVPDQNPNYKVSLEKYKVDNDNLLATMNTTVQNTYKAYDWYEAKQERKHQRISDRRERNLYRLQNYGNYYNPYNNFYDPYASPYRYSPYRRGWGRW